MSTEGAPAEDPGVRIVMMYHGETRDEMKRHIETSLRDPHGVVRVVVVSAALGRGANFPRILRMIFVRPTLWLEEFWQAAGRCARDTDLLAHISVYWKPRHVPSHKASTSMRRFLDCSPLPDIFGLLFPAFCRRLIVEYMGAEDACRRLIILKYFAFPGDRISHATSRPVPEHECCDCCRQLCVCAQCVSVSLPIAPAHENDTRATVQSHTPIILSALVTWSQAQSSLLLSGWTTDALEFAASAYDRGGMSTLIDTLEVLYDITRSQATEAHRVILDHVLRQ